MDKIARKKRRKKSIRKKIFGTPEVPRLSVHKSNRALSAQIIDDVEGRTICGLSTNSTTIAGEKGSRPFTVNNTNFAQKLGEKIAALAKENKIDKVVFDRSGYQYHGVIKVIAEAARKGGLKF